MQLMYVLPDRLQAGQKVGIASRIVIRRLLSSRQGSTHFRLARQYSLPVGQAVLTSGLVRLARPGSTHFPRVSTASFVIRRLLLSTSRICTHGAPPSFFRRYGPLLLLLWVWPAAAPLPTTPTNQRHLLAIIATLQHSAMLSKSSSPLAQALIADWILLSG